MTGIRPIPRLVASALLTIVAAGCQSLTSSELEQKQQAVDFRALYEPLAASDPDLLRRLDALDAEHVAFDLTDDGAKRVPYPLPGEALWSVQRAVFYRIQDDGATRWLYFDPLNLRVQPLEPPYPVQGDIVPFEDGGFAVYRSVIADKGGVEIRGDMEVFRFAFRFVNGRLESAGHRRITWSEGDDLQPAAMPGTERVIYVHQPENGRQELRVANPYNPDARPLFEGQDFNAAFPARLSDGRLAFFSDALGFYSLFQLHDAEAYLRELETWRANRGKGDPPDWRGRVQPFEYPFPAAREKRDIFLASLPKDGKLQPVLVRLPEELDIMTVARLVEAHNPSVNERRARYAAALVDAARFKLRNWPVLNFGLSYQDRIELLDDAPRLFTGDTLSEQVFTFFLGVAQPLLDGRRNRMLTESALHDAAVVRHQIDREIQDRVAEAAEVYFEALYLNRRLAIRDAQIAVTQARADYYDALASKGESTRLQRMSVDQALTGLRAERAFDADRHAFLLSRLKELTGLPSDTAIALADEHFRIDDYRLPPLDDAVHRALANHPSLHAARSAVASAFYQRSVGADIRPSATAGVNYENRDREFDLGTNGTVIDQDRTDEFVTLALTGQLPLASLRARRVHNDTWTHLIQALRLAQEAETRRIRTAVEEAYMDFRAAQRDNDAKESTQAFFLERLRVTRLYADYGPPGAELRVLRPIDEPGAVDETIGSGVLAPLTAKFEYLRAIDRENRTEFDLAQRLANVWREMGNTEGYLDALSGRHEELLRRQRPATWMWNTRDFIATDDTLDATVDALSRLNVRRVYAYLESDSLLLANQPIRDRFALFLQLCAGADIEVWALLGEPEWISDKDTAALARGIDRILAFNAKAGAFEPRIAGVKLDLEPHALPGWDDDGDARAQTEAAYLELFRTAQRRLDASLPLWADVPPKFFRENESDFLAEVSNHVDGLTLMDYFNAPNPILKWADIAIDEVPVPLEIGLELSPHAPETDSLAKMPPQALRALRSTLTERYLDHADFAGIALHDFTAWNERQPTE